MSSGWTVQHVRAQLAKCQTCGGMQKDNPCYAEYEWMRTLVKEIDRLEAIIEGQANGRTIQTSGG